MPCGGDETFFLTGTDEHGDKIVRAAKKDDMTPRAYVDKISALFQKLWPELNISNDQFIRTTDPAHMAVVEQILQKIYDTGRYLLQRIRRALLLRLRALLYRAGAGGREMSRSR